VAQLHAQHRRLQRIEPEIAADCESQTRVTADRTSARIDAH
jgi:hypothetical protein